jgi:ParB-like chromosome segregation protein Spo0J
MRTESPAAFPLSPDQILEDRNFSLRIFYGDIDQLAIRLMTEGQREPIKVRRREDQFFVVDGHRRQRALARARCLRIEPAGGRHMVFEEGRALREAPGPVHGAFDPDRILCLLVDDLAAEAELFASQVIHNSGKPFTLLERVIFLSRLSRLGPYTPEQLALKTGFSPAEIAHALGLNAVDPRLLDYVREGRVSEKLALRLLAAFPAERQMAKVCGAIAAAESHHRDKVLSKDFDWGAASAAAVAAAEVEQPVDPVRARLHDLASQMTDALRFAPNPAAQDRLGTLMLIHRYATGRIGYDKLEAHLLGRE